MGRWTGPGRRGGPGKDGEAARGPQGGGGGAGGPGGEGDPRGAGGEGGRGGAGGVASTPNLRRFKYFVGAALVLLAMGNGYVLQQNQHEARDRCIAALTRSREAGQALGKLGEAATKDGNPHTAAIWNEYLEAARKYPLSDC